MTKRITIQGVTPSKKNQRIVNTKTGRSFPSKRYTEWHKSAMEQLALQKGDFFCNTPCTVFMTFYHQDERRRDGDNGCSSILDTLVDAGYLEDDKWRIVKKIVIDNESCKDFGLKEAKVDIYIDVS